MTVHRPLPDAALDAEADARSYADIARFWNKVVCGQHYVPDQVSEQGTIEYYRGMRHKRLEIQSRHLRELYAFVESTSPQRVLEVGCGIGHDLFAFAAMGNEVVGLDIADEVVDLAGRYLEMEGIAGTGPGRASVQVGNGEALPFEDQSFDCVVSGVLQHTRHPQRGIDEIRRVLRPGGRAHIMLYNRHSLNYLAHRVVRPRYEDPLHLADIACPYAYHYSRREVLDMVGAFSETRHFNTYLFGYAWGWVFRITPDVVRWWLGRYVGWFHILHCTR